MQFTDANTLATQADFTATIDWGDGSPQTAATITGPVGGPFSLTGTHTYAEAGTYAIQYSIKDVDGSTLNTTQIATPPPLYRRRRPVEQRHARPHVFGVEGQTLNNVLLGTFKDGNPAATVSDFAASVGWGDMSTSIGAVTEIGGDATSTTFAVYGNHTYTSRFDHPVQRDDRRRSRGSTLPTMNTTATISDPPLLVAGGYKFAATEGQDSALQTVATFIDPGGADGPGTYPASIDWGDGSSPTSAVQTLTLTAGNPSPFTLSFTSTDATGMLTTQTTGSITLAGNDPSGDATLIAGQLNGLSNIGGVGGSVNVVADPTDTVFTVTFGGALTGFDQSNLTSDAASINVATTTHGSGMGTVTFANGFFSVKGIHDYTEESAADHPGSTPYVITVTLDHVPGLLQNRYERRDDHRSQRRRHRRVLVLRGRRRHLGFARPSPPSSTQAAAKAFDRLRGQHQLGRRPHICRGTISLTSGTFSVAGSHKYKGAYTITVTLTHELTTPQVVMSSATVSDPNVVASAVSSPVITAATGSSTGATSNSPPSSTPADAEVIGDYSASINWGDTVGTSGGTITQAGGVFTVTGSHTYAVAGTYSPKITIGHESTTAQVVTDTNRIKVTNAGAITAAGKTIAGQEGRVTSGTGCHLLGGQRFRPDQRLSAPRSSGAMVSSSAGTIVSDGTGHFHITGSHVYAEELTYATSVSIKEVGGVHRQDRHRRRWPISPLSLLDQTAGVSLATSIDKANFTNAVLGTFPRSGRNGKDPTTYTGTINWGDGHTTPATFVHVSSKYNVGSYWKIEGSHKYTAKKKFTVTITFKDLGGPSVNSVITSFITVQ